MGASGKNLSIASSTPISEAAQLMQAEDVGSLPIIEGDRLLGILTERDVVRGVAGGVPPETAAGDIVAPNLGADAAAEDSIERALTPHMRRVPVRLEFELRDRECAVDIFQRLPPSLHGCLVARTADEWRMLIEIAEPETWTLAQLVECVAECSARGDVGPAHVLIEDRVYILDSQALATWTEHGDTSH